MNAPAELLALPHEERINFESLWRDGYYTESNAYAARDAGIVLPHIAMYGQGDGVPFGWEADTVEVLTYPRTVQAYPCIKTKSPGRKPWDGEYVNTLVRYGALTEKLDVKLSFSWDADGSANAAIDVWLLKTPTGGPAEILAEVMVWFDKRGDIRPAGELVEAQVPYVTLNGYVLELWQRANYSGDGAPWPIFTFRIADGRVPNTTNVELLPLIRHLITRGSIANDAEFWVGDVEFGTELIEGKVWCMLTDFAVEWN